MTRIRTTTDFGGFCQGVTRSSAGQNSAWRGDFRQEKGPGDYPSPSFWWRRRELNPRPQYLDHRIYMRSLSIGFNRATLRQTG